MGTTLVFLWQTANVDQCVVHVGDLVLPRQYVADVGSTGRSTGPHLHFEVLVNGAPFTTTGDKRTLFYAPDGPGFVRLTVMDARGAADSVVVRVQ